MTAEIKVGPVSDGTYAYRAGGRLSQRRYANAQSAWHDARRAQRVTDWGTLVPVRDIFELDIFTE